MKSFYKIFDHSNNNFFSLSKTWGKFRFNSIIESWFSISFPFEVYGFTVAPSLNYITLDDQRISKSNTYNKDDVYFVAGISIAKGF